MIANSHASKSTGSGLVGQRRSLFPLKLRHALTTRSSVSELGSGGPKKQSSFEAGQSVKIVSDVTVYHIPGNKDGLNLKGMVGEVVELVTEYNGKPLSANLPVKIRIKAMKGEKEIKAIVHLAEGEVEVA